MADTMLSYEVTATGQTGFQVSVADAVHGTYLIGNFHSLQEAETFADDMRKVDASPSHGAAGYRIEALTRRNHGLLVAAAKARSEIKETRLKSARIRAEGKAQQALWRWLREAQRRQPLSADRRLACATLSGLRLGALVDAG